MAGPRDFMVNKVSFPLPSPQIFNLDQINTLTTDTLVSDKGWSFFSQKWNELYFMSYLSLTPFIIRLNGYCQPWRFRIWTLSLISWRDIQWSFLSNIARVVLISVLLSVKRFQPTSTIDAASAQRSLPWTNFFHASLTMKLRKPDLIFWCLFICFCQ